MMSRKATQELHEFLYKNVYIVSSAQPDAENARKVVRFLYGFLNRHQDCLPPELSALMIDLSVR